MSVNISSNNQQGGITAHTVNISSEVAPVRSAMPKPWWKKFAAPLAIFASITTILGYAEIKPWTEEAKEQTQGTKPKFNRQESSLSSKKSERKHMGEEIKNANISSNNQSGGITAQNVTIGTVNVGTHQSQITPVIDK